MLASCLSGIVRGAGIDELISALGGGDEQARARARQLLPRQGVEAVPGVLPLLGAERATVSNAAFNVLADIANEVSSPGREAERSEVAARLMTLVRPDQPAKVKERGLRLLTIAIPPDYDVAPVADLLNDPELREKAREALEEMATPRSRAALRAQLAKPDRDFACAVVSSLGRLHDREGLETIASLTRSAHPRLRAAAARALAWTGDPAYLRIAQSVAFSADPATRADAMDSLLRLLDSMARQDQHRPIAVETYRGLLGSAPGPVKDAALAGLGRFGDASSVPAILAAIRDAEPPTLLVGAEALRSLRGADVAMALVEAYPDLPRTLQAALIPVLGSRQDAAALPILEREARSGQPETRRAAIEAIGESGLFAGLELLAGAAKDGSTSIRAAARTGLLRLADGLAAKQEKDHAARAYIAAFEAADPADKNLRRQAIEGLAACPIADGYAAEKAAARDESLREPALRALLHVAGALTAAGRKDEALELYETVNRLNPPEEVLRSMVRGMAAAGVKKDLAGLLGTVTRWWIVGPFDLGDKNQGWETSYVAEPAVNLVGRYMSGKTRVQWKPVISHDPHGKVDLRASLANRDHCLGYAYAEIALDSPADAVLLLGVDDGEKVWVNGTKVFELFTARGLQVDQDRVPVHLKAGTNTILLKIYQDTQGWEFCVRITTPDGRPVQFVQRAE
jgi:HEAT repeat protein